MNCTRCEGKGVYDLLGQERDCPSCQGTGMFPQVNESIILSNIIAKSGKNKGKLKSSMTSPFRSDGVDINRAYYVWRMARFHGGVDMTMPITAGFAVKGDPYVKELDTLADKLAKESFGSDMRGAMRWGKAFGMFG